jgi:hypothetical protein
MSEPNLIRPQPSLASKAKFAPATEGCLWKDIRTGTKVIGLLGVFESKFLHGVGGSDPASLAGASLVRLTVAMLACFLTARRASRVDLLALHES